MDIGIVWDACGWNVIGTAEQIDLLKRHGFTHIFIDAHHPDLDNTVHAVREAGIAVDFCHAPFDHINDMWLDGEAGDVMLGRLKSCVDSCARLSIPTLIVHLSAGDNCPHITDCGFTRFKALVDHADESGVIIAFENQRKLANIAFAFEVYPTARFCWDTGHEDCFAYGRRYMPLFGDKLVSLHIHDNDGEHNHDFHMIPFDSKVDFDRVARSIAEVRFEGTIMLEVFRKATHFYDGMSDDEYYARAAAAAARIRDRVVGLMDNAD